MERQPALTDDGHDQQAARCHRLIRDDRGDVPAAVREALPGADMLVASGAISVSGEHDAVKAAPRDLGTVSFGKVAMQPGMPQGQQQGTVTPAPGRSTHLLAALGRSNALIVVPECVTALAAGATVEVLELQP